MQPTAPRRGWDTDIFVSPEDDEFPEAATWTIYVTLVTEWGWLVEHGLHFYGTFIPIVRRREPDYFIFRVGSLLIVEDEWEEEFHVLDTTNVYEAMDIVDSGSNFLRHVSLGCHKMDRTVENESSRFLGMWQMEWMDRGRNRWQELKDRGGEVDPCWTEKRPVRDLRRVYETMTLLGYVLRWN